MATHAVERRFPLDDISAIGHFPGNPIIPGAVLLREVVNAVSNGHAAICQEVRSAKFLHPVRPGDVLGISWRERAEGDIGFTCRVDARGITVLTGTLVMRPR
jgi:3-hydroxyacyl-[acyl-carrier-protein] dehydratase